MKNIRDFLGCRCHGLYQQHSIRSPQDKTPPHTFAWAKRQYPEERPVWPATQSLDLVLDIEKCELSGSNTISYTVVQNEVQSFDIDAVDMKIHDVQVNGKSARFTIGDKAITVHLDGILKRGDTGQVKISYSVQNPRAGIYFIKPDKAYLDRPVQVWTQGQDDDAKFWFPSFDEPRIKCSLDLRVEVPAGYVATSNGTLHSESRGGKTWTFHWKTATPIPSYLVTLTAGKFSEIRDDWRGKVVNYLVEKGREDEARLSFGKTPRMMDLFSKITGVDYPYEKYTQIAAAEFIFGGMENTSATTQSDATLHPHEIDEDYTSDDLVSHELAHQWFGDLVTCKTWSHGWLNEGWATFMEQVFKEHDLGKDEADYYRFEEFNIYSVEDKTYRRPVVTNFYSDPGEVWDRHLYQKGGLILNLLRHELGDEDFWAGTREYLTTHKGGTVETIDFQRALEKTSGRNLQQFFDQWVYGGGYPELKATFEWDEKNKLGQFRLEQKQKTDEVTPLFAIHSMVEFVMGDESKVGLSLRLDEATKTFCVPLKEKPQYLRFDVGNNIIKSLEWAMPTEMVKNQLVKDKDVVGKIWALKQLAKEGAKEGVEVLVRALKTDAFWGVRAEAALALGEVKTEDALTALVSALGEEKRSRTRQKIALALGEFRDERASGALIGALEKDASLFVKGAAAEALGKTKSPRAFDHLRASLKIKTWRDWLAAQVYVGLKNLRDQRALELFVDGAQYGSPKFARLTACAALGEYGLDKPEVTEFLEQALKDPFHRVRFVAADALVRRKDPAAIPAIEDAAYRNPEGHFKASAFRAAKRLREAQERPQEFINFQEKLDKLSDENRKLQDRLSRLEQTT